VRYYISTSELAVVEVIMARTSVPSETEGSRNDSRAVKERATKMGEGIWNGEGGVLHYIV